MAKMKAARRVAEFNLGGEQAEADPLLEQAFYHTGQYAALNTREDPRCFVIGRTGSGKSAILQRIEAENPGHVIRIDPEDLSLPYIADLGVVHYLASLDVHLDPFFIALWKHVILIEIIKHRYRVNTPSAKQNFLTGLRDKLSKDRSKSAALDYLEDFSDKFWCETDERVRDITTKFEEQISKEAGGKVSYPSVAEISARASDGSTYTTETKAQLADRFQRIVNETQLPRLNKMISVLDEEILDSSQDFTYIVIDDLDRDWVDEKVRNALIRCLFRTVVDLKKVKNLKVLVALRTNILEQVDWSRTGTQEEKFRSLSITLRWTHSDLERLLSTRTRGAAEQHGISSPTTVDELLPTPNRTRGSALAFILKRTLMRPRDALAYVNECLALTGGKARVSWTNIHDAEASYSKNRFLALRDEWKSSYPGIDILLRLFEGKPKLISPRELKHILDDAALLPADANFAGTGWMTLLAEPIWNSTAQEPWPRSYQELLRLLFHIGFIGCCTKNSGPVVYAHERPDFLDQLSNVENCESFTVHPTFRRALDIRSPSQRTSHSD